MKILIILLITNIIFIFCNEKNKNDTIGDDEEDIINNLFNDIDKLFNGIMDEIDIENDLIEDELIIDDDLNFLKDYNIKFEDILNENEIDGLKDDDDDSIWPERPIPRYKNIV